jgi:hypothetical protein
MSECFAVGHDFVAGKKLKYSKATWLSCKLFRKMEELLHRQKTQKMHTPLSLMQFRRRERCGWSLPALVNWWCQFWYGKQITPINHFKDSNIGIVTASAVSTHLTNCVSTWHCFYQGVGRRMEPFKLLYRQTFPFGFLHIALFFFFYCYQSLSKSFWCWLPFRSF